MKQKFSELARNAQKTAAGLIASASAIAHDANSTAKAVSTAIVESTKRGTQRTRQAISGTSEAIEKSARTSIDTAKSAASSVSKVVQSAADTTGQVVATAAGKTKRTASTVATTILDQNGDGKLDQEDVKLLTEKGISLAKAGASEAAKAARAIASSDIVKESAAAAAVGAAIAGPLPIVGPATGALIGGAAGAYLHVKNKNKKP